MFLANRKPDAKMAQKTLQRHLIMLGAWVGFVRVLPYALQALQDSRAAQ